MFSLLNWHYEPSTSGSNVFLELSMTRGLETFGKHQLIAKYGDED